jgi:hypothetical protein
MTNQIHGCKEMKRQLELRCDRHNDPFQCADRLIIYSPRFDEYGIIIHDGGSSYSVIRYCPWCGKKLPPSKRDRWFKVLEARGYEDPAKQKIPPEFLTDEWYRRPLKNRAVGGKRRKGRKKAANSN